MPRQIKHSCCIFLVLCDLRFAEGQWNKVYIWKAIPQHDKPGKHICCLKENHYKYLNNWIIFISCPVTLTLEGRAVQILRVPQCLSCCLDNLFWLVKQNCWPLSCYPYKGFLLRFDLDLQYGSYVWHFLSDCATSYVWCLKTVELILLQKKKVFIQFSGLETLLTLNLCMGHSNENV